MLKQVDWKKFSEEFIVEHGHIYIFRVRVDDYYAIASKEAEYILSKEELQKAKRYVKEEDAKNSVSSKLVLRKLLSRFLLIEPSKIQFHQSANKKPAVDGIEFNISHSQGQVLIVIGPNPVGIDIEYINQQLDIEFLAPTVLHQLEIPYVLSPEKNIGNFYTVWTRKEALLKASGEGLTDDLGAISVLEDITERNSCNYSLFTFLTDEHHIASLACANGTNQIIYYSIP